jgi:hypothetical protein
LDHALPAACTCGKATPASATPQPVCRLFLEILDERTGRSLKSCNDVQDSNEECQFLRACIAAFRESNLGCGTESGLEHPTVASNLKRLTFAGGSNRVQDLRKRRHGEAAVMLSPDLVVGINRIFGTEWRSRSGFGRYPGDRRQFACGCGDLLASELIRAEISVTE